jgi:hypothetical protein
MLIEIKDTEFLMVSYHFINVRSLAFWMAVNEISELCISNKVHYANGKDYHTSFIVLVFKCQIICTLRVLAILWGGGGEQNGHQRTEL